MIKVTNLTKIYEDKQKSLKALDDVSFVLPDKGFIFIVGKSGSGKSTLINMLGALDDATSGSVEIDGLDICKSDINRLNKYRNEYLGIIYQNYNLFSQESVLENIKIASDICKNKIEEVDIEGLLKEVDLENIQKKRVKNLSGGQKQRVAIARALIKNPKLILADEPTGNLDSRTSKKIFDLLLKISKERLVVVITHDIKSAYNYADRIIEISDGRISKDLIRNPALKGNTITYLELDQKQSINDEELKSINKEIINHKYKIIRKEELFSEYENNNEASETKLELTSKQKFGNIFKTCFKLLKANKFSIIMTSLITMLVIGILSVTTEFVQFDGKSAIHDVLEMYDVKNLVIRKSYSKTGRSTDLEKNDMLKINDADEEKLKTHGYVGNKYPVYTCDMPISGEAWPAVHMSTHNIKFESFYSDALSGVVLCDDAYLHHLFGDYEILAGSLYDIKNTGKIIVTDFVADSLLFWRNSFRSKDPDDPYQKIVNTKLFSRMIIGAIVKTNYKEKYETFLDTVNRIKREPSKAADLTKAIIGSSLYSEFLNDANSYLNYGYTFNPDYVESQSKINQVFHLMKGYFSTQENGPEFYPSIADSYDGAVSSKLTDNNVSLCLPVYNEMFGKNLDKPTSPEFEEKDFYFYKYSNESELNHVVEKVYKFHIQKVHNQSNPHDVLIVSQDMFEDIVNWQVFQYAWAFDNVQQCYDLYNKLTRYGFYNCVTCFDAVYNTINIILIVRDVFNVLFFVFIAVLAIIAVMHNRRLMKSEQYRLGVYKSLGYSNFYLTLAFVFINVLTCIVIFGISLLFSWGAGEAANFLIQFGFYKWSKNIIYYSIRMLSFSVLNIGFFSLLVLGIMLLSTLIPLFVIRKIKPSKIIRNAE
jgi:ABC-type lipoprotein export system ATPase subunit